MVKSSKSREQNKIDDSDSLMLNKHSLRSHSNIIQKIFNRRIRKRMNIKLIRELTPSIFYRSSESTSYIVDQFYPQIQSLSNNIELNNPFYSDVSLFNVIGRKFDLGATIKVMLKNFWNFVENSIYVMSNIRRKKDLFRKRKNFHQFKNYGKYRHIMNEKIRDIFERLYYTNLEEIIQQVLDSNKSKKVKKEILKFFELNLRTVFIFYRSSLRFWKDSKKYCKNDIRFALNYIEVAKKFMNILNRSEYVNYRTLPVDDFLPYSFSGEELNFLNSINSCAVEYFTKFVDSKNEIVPQENFTSNNPPFETSFDSNSDEYYFPNHIDSNEEIFPQENLNSNPSNVVKFEIIGDEEIMYIDYNSSNEFIDPIEYDVFPISSPISNKESSTSVSFSSDKNIPIDYFQNNLNDNHTLAMFGTIQENQIDIDHK